MNCLKKVSVFLSAELVITCQSLWAWFALVLQSWEFGIPLCRELAIQYESLYDYQSLSWIRVSSSSSSPCRIFSILWEVLSLLSGNFQLEKNKNKKKKDSFGIDSFQQHCRPTKVILGLPTVTPRSIWKTHAEDLGLPLPVCVYFCIKHPLLNWSWVMSRETY